MGFFKTHIWNPSYVDNLRELSRVNIYIIYVDCVKPREMKTFILGLHHPSFSLGIIVILVSIK